MRGMHPSPDRWPQAKLPSTQQGCAPVARKSEPSRMKLSAIFFDVGNTLVLPDLSRTLAPLYDQGVRPTAEQLNAAERAAKTELDSRHPTDFKSTDQQYWDTYYSFLLRQLRTSDPAVKAKLIKEARTSANWDVVQAGTRELLEDLQHRFRLGVISN